MTRINSHQVIQMIGQDKIVFVDGDSGLEVLLPLAKVAELVDTVNRLVLTGSLGPRDTFGFYDKEPGGPSVDFYVEELDAVTTAVDYFVACSRVPVADQLAQLQMIDLADDAYEPDDPKRPGYLDDLLAAADRRRDESPSQRLGREADL